MKKLKLDHELAELVLAGKKTSTWRLFDDKDLTVNDTIELIDKVDPDQPQTWRVIGTARVNRVIEKRIGDITDADYDGHETHESPEARLQAYRGYYADRVTWDTPIKMIHFDFTPGQSDEQLRSIESLAAAVPTRNGSAALRVVLYADGGSRGNPGPSACGYVILDADGQVMVDKGMYLGITTNNQAEYQGLKSGLEEAKRIGAQIVDVRLDSLLVVNQMRGVYKVRNRDLWPIHQSTTDLAGTFERVTFTHVPRELNRLADAAVNRTLDEAAVEDDGIGAGE